MCPNISFVIEFQLLCKKILDTQYKQYCIRYTRIPSNTKFSDICTVETILEHFIHNSIKVRVKKPHFWYKYQVGSGCDVLKIGNYNPNKTVQHKIFMCYFSKCMSFIILNLLGKMREINHPGREIK